MILSRLTSLLTTIRLDEELQPRRRGGMIVLGGVILVGTLYWGKLLFLVIGHTKYSEFTTKAPEEIRRIEARRGDILDRNGLPLAQEIGGYVDVAVNPTRVVNPVDLAQALSRITKKPQDHYLSKLKRPVKFVYLERKLDPQTAAQLDSLPWSLIKFPTTCRVYPFKSRARQLLGATDIDNRGISGLELAFDSLLSGKPGLRWISLDVKGNPYLSPKGEEKRPQEGKNLHLTIDADIQGIVEEELARGVKTYRATSASAIVMDPNNGEIFAIATYPLFVPSRTGNGTTSIERLRPVHDQFEPGSVFKAITAAFLLEKGWLTPNSTVSCSDIKIEKWEFEGDKRSPTRTFKEAMAYSINTGFIHPIQYTSSEEFYAFIRQMGFLQKTGIPFPGEASGFLLPPSQWSLATSATVSIGHGISVTMLQLAAAYSAIANGGIWIQPRLIKRISDPNSSEPYHLPEPLSKRVLTPHCVKMLTEMLKAVVDSGTGTLAKLDGVSVAGKTGTAQRVNPNGGYYKDRYIASFIGFFPVFSPRCLILITVEDPCGPQNQHTGGLVAAPIFRSIAQRILEIYPQWRERRGWNNPTGTVAQVVLPNLKEKKVDILTYLSSTYSLIPKVSGSGEVIIDQFPLPGAPLSPGDSLMVICSSPSSPLREVKLTGYSPPGSGSGQVPLQKERKGELLSSDSLIVPIFLGLSLRDAFLKAKEWGVRVELKGMGRVVRQSPEPGSVVSSRQVCQLIGFPL